MSQEPRIGLYVCHCGKNIAGVVDVNRVVEAFRNEPNVVVTREYRFMCSTPGQEFITEDIGRQGLNRVVVAACSPRMHEETFQKACSRAGLNPFFFQMANIREQDSWVTLDKEAATQKAIQLVRAAVYRVRDHEPLEFREVEVHPDVLIVGGGIAGIEAALTVAEGGNHVYLVEKEPSIGGHMARFDKTFPTLDCSACILTPKMNSVGSHPNITLLTSSEVVDVEGFVGNFTARIRTRARYVDHDLCNGCGACTEKCPVKVDSEFEQGLAKRKAIYTPFAQAVPNKPVIDRDACTFFKTGKCKICVHFCEPKAIFFDMTEEEREIRIGSIIVATGFQFYDGPALAEYGHKSLPDVVSSLEFERMNNSAGPTSGEIVTSKGKAPESVAILHCIGSRDKNHQEFCSRVCCMYSLKFAHLVKEKTGAEVYEFYIDIRSPGKGYEEFYDRIREEGVHFIRGKVGEVTDMACSPEEQGRLVVVAENTLTGQRLRIPVDMVILSPGMSAPESARQIASILKCAQDRNGFFIEKHPKLAPIDTAIDGVFLAGACQGPKDIPDSVAQGQAAAARALALASRGVVQVEARTSWIHADSCAGCKLCLSLCPYKAISFDLEKKASVINEVLCKGCGTCAAACPGGAAQARHFRDVQIFNEIAGVLAL